MSENIKYDNIFRMNNIIMLIEGKKCYVSTVDKSQCLLFSNSPRNVNDHHNLINFECSSLSNFSS